MLGSTACCIEWKWRWGCNWKTERGKRKTVFWPFKPQDQNLNSHLLLLFFSHRRIGEKLIKYQANLSCVIMSVILMTTLFYKALILQGEIWCWSLLGLKESSVILTMFQLFELHIRGGEWYLKKRGSPKILAGSRNLESILDKSQSLVFAWFVFTFLGTRNFLTKSLGLWFLTRILASRRVSDFTIRHPSYVTGQIWFQVRIF